MPLSDYACAKGGYTDPDGCCWSEDATSLLQCGIIRMCGCGDPESNLRYIQRGLEIVAIRADCFVNGHIDWNALTLSATDMRARENSHFCSDVAKDFFYYWADKEGYTEHGTALPGWLTDKGKHLLDLLQEWSNPCPPSTPCPPTST